MGTKTPPTPPTSVRIVGYYDANSSSKCFLSAPLHVFQIFVEQAICNMELYAPEEAAPAPLDKKSWHTLEESVRSFLVIMPTLLNFTLARLCFHQLPLTSTRRFICEFLLISLPVVCNLTVASDYNDLYCAVALALIIYYFWCSRFWLKASSCIYEIGKRPIAYTLLRATVYTGTCAGILGVDFSQFPLDYRKSRAFGASIMDLGIGLFIFTMGLVSHRSRNFNDLRRLPKVVLPLLVLGLGRTLVITLIDYRQDEHEYGQHLNAFFTLGLTKLLGSLFTLLARSDAELLPLSLAILGLHELGLQLGLSDFVMFEYERDNLFTANREGLSQLPGSVALFLLSMYLSKWYTAKQQLSYVEMKQKLRHLLLISLVGWSLVFLSAFTTGISRVTSNTGYIIFVFTVAETLLLLYTLIFHFALCAAPALDKEQQKPLIGDASDSTKAISPLPVFVETLSMNGLTFFMLCNLLTGLVNMTLNPSARKDIECVLILTLYMLLGVGVVYILFRRRIRIA